jgi:glycosyltransferase involved in cell wall biosynthesis
VSDTWDLAHVITKLELGGAQLATLYEVEHATACTGDRFLLYGPGGMLEPEARALEKVRAVEVPALAREVRPGRDARAVAQLSLALRRLRTPGRRLLVHTHSSKAGILGRGAARAAGADVVVHSIHGFGHADPWAPALRRGAFLAAEQLAAHITDGYTADSAANLDQAWRDGILGQVPARVVRCGIDTGAFAKPARQPAAVRAELGCGSDVVLGAFCFKPQKDPITFLRVAAEVLRHRPDTEFWLAGDGELRPVVEEEIGRLGIGERVRLLGWRRDVADLLHACDLLLHTSLWEGLPQVFPQAMVAGRAVVATSVDGAPEAIEDGVTGLLCAPGDVHALAAAVVQLLADPALRETMGRSGKAAAAAFSRERMVEELDRLYLELMGGPRRRARLPQALVQARHWFGSVRSAD